LFVRSNALGTIWHFLSLFDTGLGRAPAFIPPRRDARPFRQGTRGYQKAPKGTKNCFFGFGTGRMRKGKTLPFLYRGAHGVTRPTLAVAKLYLFFTFSLPISRFVTLTVRRAQSGKREAADRRPQDNWPHTTEGGSSGASAHLDRRPEQPRSGAMRAVYFKEQVNDAHQGAATRSRLRVRARLRL